MVEVTRREKTEEEKKVIEETRNATGKWMGEEKMEDIVKPEPEDGQRVDLKLLYEHLPHIRCKEKCNSCSETAKEIRTRLGAHCVERSGL